MEQLKKCPFCGGEADVFKASDLGDFSWNSDRFTVKCRSCFCGTGLYSDSERTIEMWNTRKPMERIVERLEKVKNREANGECPIDGMCDKKPYECTSCYSNTAIEIVKEEM